MGTMIPQRCSATSTLTAPGKEIQRNFGPQAFTEISCPELGTAGNSPNAKSLSIRRKFAFEITTLLLTYPWDRPMKGTLWR
tara:strand:- start:344 stop:586 length:243 start_codon:yes stop_codon:yes gene_type:complete